MQWIEVTIKTTSAAIDLVCDRLTVLGFDSFIIDDQQDFERFLEENHQYWDYVDEDLEQKMQGLSQIRLYLEDSAAAPEQISTLRDDLAVLRRDYPAVDFGSLEVALANVRDEDWENNNIISPSPSARSSSSCRSGSTPKTRRTASSSCSTPA